MNWSRECSLYRYIANAHRNYEQRAEKSVRRWRWNPHQAAKRSNRECKHKS
jgi:hypothetical protein